MFENAINHVPTMLSRLIQMQKCSQNYSFISEDLVYHCRVGSTRNTLALLLKYYSRGLRRAFNSIPDDTTYSWYRNDIKDSLNEIDINLLACEIELPFLPEADGERFEIPNASVIELLVKSYLENIQFSQPYTLSERTLLQSAGMCSSL